METFFVFLVLLVIVAVFTVKAYRKTRRKLLHRKPRNRGPADNWGLADPKNQLEAVSRVNFEKVKLMNAAEYRVFKFLENTIASIGAGHRVMAQTSLGEIIKPSRDEGDWRAKKNAFASINSKRLDFCVVDKNGFVVLAVEYQGSGHHQQKAFMRDAVKREALRRAGIPFLEVEKGMKPAELKNRIENYLLSDGQVTLNLNMT